MLEKSQSVYESTSFNGEYGLLYNSKNDFFIRYKKSDFANFEHLCTFPDILNFLKEKSFLKLEAAMELEEIKNIHSNTLKSEDTLMLIIKITKDCNFRCTYCYESFENRKIPEDIENGIIKFIDDKLQSSEIKHVVISWFGGEPLLNVECIERMSAQIIDSCNKHNVKYSSSVVTNGYLLNEQIVAKLLNAHVHNFQVTIDGPSYIHNAQRKSIDGEDTYSTIKDNLLKLKHFDGKFHVVLRANISPEIVPCISEYEDDFLLEFTDDKRFLAMYHPVVDFSDCRHLVNDTEVLELIIHSVMKGIQFAPLVDYLSSKNSFCYGIKENQFVIDVDGNLSKCTVVDGDYAIVGKITKDGIMELNNNYDLWINARLSPKCDGCESFASCGGGACPLYYFKHSVSRCMKYKNNDDKEKILKITEFQGGYDLTLRLE